MENANEKRSRIRRKLVLQRKEDKASQAFLN